MTDVSRYLQAILDAQYGEQVRGSIHDALQAFSGDLDDICLGADGHRYDTPGNALRAQTQHIVDGVDEQIDEILDSYDEWYQHLRQEFTTYRDALKHILNEGSMEEPVEVLENGNFEDGFNNWDHPNSGMTIETDSDGNYVHCTASTQWGSFKQQFAFSEPGNYLISFKVKGNVTMELVNNNWDHDIIGPQIYNPSYWAPISLPITVGSGQLLNCAILFFHDGSSDWSVRDISILQQASTLDTLANNINSIALNVDGLKTQMDIVSYDAASFHNSVYRGKYLGTEITTDQKEAIHDGSFEDMYIGDFWVIENRVFRIAHFDYYVGHDIVSELPLPHHITIIPDDSLSSQVPYIPSGSAQYSSSYSNTWLKVAANYLGSPDLSSNPFYWYFEPMALKHYNSFPYGPRSYSGTLDGVNYGYSYDARYLVYQTFSDSWAELLNEPMLFGTYLNFRVEGVTPWTAFSTLENISYDNKQLALFKLAPKHIRSASPYGYWIADTAGDYALFVNDRGIVRMEPTVASGSDSVTRHDIRPYITICGEN